MDTRKVFKTGNSIAVTIPKKFGLSAGDAVMVDRIGESNTIVLTKVPRNIWMPPEDE